MSSSSDSSIYFAEKILAKKYKNGKRYFLIKWIGYDESENSWEPEENLNPLMEGYFDSMKEECSGFDTQNTLESKKHKVTKKRKNSITIATQQSKEQPLVAEKNEDSIEEQEDDSINDPKQAIVEECVDSVDTNQNNQIYNSIKITPNSSQFDSESSSSEEHQEANLELLETQSTPKRRLILIKGYAARQFDDKKLRMVVKYEDENKLNFVLHEELRRDYPQELIDYYEKSTSFSDKGFFYK